MCQLSNTSNFLPRILLICHVQILYFFLLSISLNLHTHTHTHTHRHAVSLWPVTHPKVGLIWWEKVLEDQALNRIYLESSGATKFKNWVLVLLEPKHFQFLDLQCGTGFTGGSDSKECVWQSRTPGSIPGLERVPGEGNGNPLQYSCLGNPMDKKTWCTTVHGIAELDATESLSLSQCGIQWGELHGTYVLWTQPGDFDLTFSSAIDMRCDTCLFIYLIAPGLSWGMCDLVLRPQIESGPLRWEHGVLVTGPTSEFPWCVLLGMPFFLP